MEFVAEYSFSKTFYYLPFLKNYPTVEKGYCTGLGGGGPFLATW
jgi:hypothetical protein